MIEDIIDWYSWAVLLVSHRVENKVLIRALLGIDNSHFWNIKQDAFGITRFTYEKGGFILTSHNNTRYLKPINQAMLSDF